MKYQFGSTSKKRAKNVSEYLINAADEALAASLTDMTIPWRGGRRTAKQQREIYDRGASKADGYGVKSYHQSGKALDIIPYFDGKGHYFDVDSEFIEFAKLMFMAFDNMKEAGEVPSDVYLHWGGFWGDEDLNNDGFLEAFVDKTGWDKAHWELRPYPQRNILKLK
jgi:peptidoglycan L-alanyl-D-glutamate endopeptidase CwlK